MATITGRWAARTSKAESFFLFAAAAGLVVSVATEAVAGKLVPALVLLVAVVRSTLTASRPHSHTSLGDQPPSCRIRSRRVALTGALFVELRTALSGR